MENEASKAKVSQIHPPCHVPLAQIPEDLAATRKHSSPRVHEVLTVAETN